MHLENVLQNKERVYSPEDRPPAWVTFICTIKHLTVMLVGVIAPPIIIGGALGLSTSIRIYLISASLLMAGIATLIQAKPWKIFGSGLLGVQGPSFIFVGVLINIALKIMAEGKSEEEALAAIAFLTIAGAFFQLLTAFTANFLRHFLTPLISGICIILAAFSLLKYALIDFAGGEFLRRFNPEVFAGVTDLALGTLTIVTIIMLNCFNSKYVRLASVAFALILGYVLAFLMGRMDGLYNAFIAEAPKWISMPIPFKFGFYFDWSGLVAILILYFLSTAQAIGDITATCVLGKKPILGKKFTTCLSKGLFGDALASVISGILGSTPLNFFAQNAQIIKITAVSSRYIGIVIASVLIIMSLLPAVSVIILIIPKPVLGGAVLWLLVQIIGAGLKIILAVPKTGANKLIICLSFVAAFLTLIDFSPWVPNFLSLALDSPVVTGGVVAVVANLFLGGKGAGFISIHKYKDKSDSADIY